MAKSEHTRPVRANVHWIISIVLYVAVMLMMALPVHVNGFFGAVLFVVAFTYMCRAHGDRYTVGWERKFLFAGLLMLLSYLALVATILLFGVLIFTQQI